MEQVLLVLTGLPGAGKTTFARQWVLEDPSHRIRVNRDDIRRALGPYWVPSREDLVTKLENTTIAIGLSNKYSVVVDATNFKFDYLYWENWMKEEHVFYSNSINIETKSFTDVPLEECIKRDLLRSEKERIGESVIVNFYNKYIKDKI